MKFNITTIFISLIVIIFAIFLQLDSDLTIYLYKYNSNNLNNNIIWITGASSGIGSALALELTKSGAQVIISARRLESLNDVANQCEVYGKRPLVLPLDVTNIDGHKEAYDKIISTFGRLDRIILNAGRSQRSPAVDFPISMTKELFELNFFSVVALTTTILPDMIDRKQGHIIVVSSTSGTLGTPVATSYSASKFALHGYFDGLRGEVGQHNISISLFCPGPVETDIELHTFKSKQIQLSAKEKKMPVDRCAYLIAKGISNRLPELWLSDQPILFFQYLARYLPSLYRPILIRFAGPGRLRALETGGQINNIVSMFTFNNKQ
mmetsp:Transcript_20384/g.18524  ORF Transcript_20384/g.18524 Transcript_20384/m.18524 type:complete len:323 (+) Transcript_20384:1-969(+)